MSSPEDKIYEKFKSALKRELPKGRYHLQRIETSTGTGIPDVYFRYGRHGCWIETKTTDYAVSKEQYAWASAEIMAGGQCWVLTEVGGRLMFYGFDSPMVGVRLGTYLREHSVLFSMSIEAWLVYYGSD